MYSLNEKLFFFDYYRSFIAIVLIDFIFYLIFYLISIKVHRIIKKNGIWETFSIREIESEFINVSRKDRLILRYLINYRAIT